MATLFGSPPTATVPTTLRASVEESKTVIELLSGLTLTSRVLSPVKAMGLDCRGPTDVCARTSPGAYRAWMHQSTTTARTSRPPLRMHCLMTSDLQRLRSLQFPLEHPSGRNGGAAPALRLPRAR